jgi:hypothetical protein
MADLSVLSETVVKKSTPLAQLQQFQNQNQNQNQNRVQDLDDDAVVQEVMGTLARPFQHQQQPQPPPTPQNLSTQKSEILELDSAMPSAGSQLAIPEFQEVREIQDVEVSSNRAAEKKKWWLLTGDSGTKIVAGVAAALLFVIVTMLPIERLLLAHPLASRLAAPPTALVVRATIMAAMTTAVAASIGTAGF